MDDRRVGRLALLAGVLVAANPLYLGVWTTTGELYADPVDAATATENADGVPVVRYGNLSPHARLVVGRTVERGHYTVLGPWRRPARFVYPDGLDEHPGEYFVVHDGRYYDLRTYGGGTFGWVYLVVQFALVGLGAYAAVAGRRARRGDRGPALPALAGATGLVLLALGPPLGFPGLGVGRWAVVVLAATVTLAAVGGSVRVVRRVARVVGEDAS